MSETFEQMLARKRAAGASSAAPEWETEEMGTGRAFARGAGQGASLGFADEGAGLVDAVGHGYQKLLKGDFEVSGDGLSKWYDDFVGDYRKGRDEARGRNALAEQAHGGAYLGGQVTGGLATGVLSAPLAGAGVTGALVAGGAEGAAAGLGGSDTDLTDADVEQYVQAAGDTLTGAGFGVLGATAGTALGYGAKALGGRVKTALGRARGALEQEAAAGERAQLQALLDEVDAAHGPGLEMNKRADLAAQRQAEREAERLARAQGQAMEMDSSLEARRAAAAAREQERLAREQGQAMEMNRRLDATDPGAPRFPREPGAQLQRSGLPPEPRVAPQGPLPNGRVRGPASADELGEEALIGYERKARQQVQHQADMVRQRQAGLERGDYIPGERTMMREYVDAHRLARENPAAARRGYIREWIAMKYGDDVAERLISRFDEGGRFIRTGNPAADAVGAAAESATGEWDFNDLGRIMDAAPEDLARRGGGGSALDGLRNAETRAERILPEPGERVTQQVELAELRREELGLRPAGRGHDTRPDFSVGRGEDFAPADADLAARKTGVMDMADDFATEEMVRRLDAAREARRAAPPPVSGGTPTRSMGPARTPTPATAEVPAQASLALGERLPAPPPPAAPPAPQTFSPRLPPEGFVSDSARATARAAEAGAGRSMLGAAYRGFTGARNGLAAPVGAAWEVGKEALRNPAVRARALAASRLSRLESANPALFARVGASLASALAKGPDEYAVTRHVLLQTDPEFQEAEAQADEEQSGLSDDELAQQLRAAGALR